MGITIPEPNIYTQMFCLLTQNCVRMVLCAFLLNIFQNIVPQGDEIVQTVCKPILKVIKIKTTTNPERQKKHEVFQQGLLTFKLEGLLERRSCRNEVMNEVDDVKSLQMLFSLKRHESLSPPAPERVECSRLNAELSGEDHRKFRAELGWKCAIGQEYYNKALNVCVEL